MKKVLFAILSDHELKARVRCLDEIDPTWTEFSTTELTNVDQQINHIMNYLDNGKRFSIMFVSINEDRRNIEELFGYMVVNDMEIVDCCHVVSEYV